MRSSAGPSRDAARSRGVAGGSPTRRCPACAPPAAAPRNRSSSISATGFISPLATQTNSAPRGRFCTHAALTPESERPDAAPQAHSHTRDQKGEGGSECAVCGAGNYSANALSCEPCQVAEYCPEGSVIGKMCPPGSTTEGRGAESLYDCGCPAGTFDTASGDEISCEPCDDDHMLCARTGLTLATAPLPPSRWRLSVTDHHIQPFTADLSNRLTCFYVLFALPESHRRHQDMRHIRRRVPLPWRR